MNNAKELELAKIFIMKYHDKVLLWEVVKDFISMLVSEDRERAINCMKPLMGGDKAEDERVKWSIRGGE